MNQNEMVTLRLPRLFVGQVLDGLDVLIEQWEYTAQYHEDGLIRGDMIVRECTDEDEARWIAAFYREIRDEIERQGGRKGEE